MTRTAKKTAEAPAKKTAAKRTTAAATRPASKRQPRKTTANASLVKPRKPLPVRERDFMTEIQGYATLAARIVGITTPHIRQWVDHQDGTTTRRLLDGTLHYNQAARTLSWQATCRMGAVHTYPIPTPGAAVQARVLAARCTQLHADLSIVPPLTPDELEALGLLQTPTWARPDLLGDDITETIPVPLPDHRQRALGDALTHSGKAVDDTQPMSTQQIAAHIAEHAADLEQTKEHPQT